MDLQRLHTAIQEAKLDENMGRMLLEFFDSYQHALASCS